MNDKPIKLLNLFSMAVMSAVFVNSLFAAPAPAGQAPPAHYHQIKKIKIGGEGGWDYLTLDNPSHRLFISRGTHVMVLDVQTGKLVGDIANTPGVHGIALAPKLNRGFTSNGRDNSVTVFDLMTLKEIQRIPVGRNPDAIIYDAVSKRVFTFNGSSNDVTAIDVETGKVVGTIPVGGKPEFSVSDEKGTVFCNVEDTNQIVAIDAKALKASSHWSIAPCDGPSGLAIDRAHHRLFAVCGNQKMAVVDSVTGKLLATPAIGNGPDAAAFDPALGLAFSSNGADGTLTLVHEDNPESFRAAATVPTQRGARTMTLDPKTHNIYLITATFKPAEAGTQRRPAMEPDSAVILVYGP